MSIIQWIQPYNSTCDLQPLCKIPAVLTFIYLLLLLVQNMHYCIIMPHWIWHSDLGKSYTFFPNSLPQHEQKHLQKLYPKFNIQAFLQSVSQLILSLILCAVICSPCSDMYFSCCAPEGEFITTILFEGGFKLAKSRQTCVDLKPVLLGSMIHIFQNLFSFGCFLTRWIEVMFKYDVSIFHPSECKEKQWSRRS